MATIKNFKILGILDIAVIISSGIFWLFIIIFTNRFFSPQYSYISSLFAAALLVSFLVHIIRKVGSAVLFYLVAALLSYNTGELGVTGMQKIVSLLIAGMIFEIIFLMLKLEIKNIKLDIIIGTAVSSASIPLTLSILLSPNVAFNSIVPMADIVLLSFWVGMIGSMISFLIWRYLRTTKTLLKFEYRQ